MTTNSRSFHFAGSGLGYAGVTLAALALTVITLGVCYPEAVVLKHRWRARHCFVDGQRMIFTGSPRDLAGGRLRWLAWLALVVLTLGVGALWVGARVARWTWESTDVDVHWLMEEEIDAEIERALEEGVRLRLVA